MKIFIFSTFVVGMVALTSAQGRNGYAPNNGINSPGTFNEMGTAGIESDVSRETVPSLRVDPETLNTSPNPVPESIDDPSYGETITSKNPLKNRQAQEEMVEKSKARPKR